jgi:hypothetical protein
MTRRRRSPWNENGQKEERKAKREFRKGGKVRR